MVRIYKDGAEALGKSNECSQLEPQAQSKVTTLGNVTGMKPNR